MRVSPSLFSLLGVSPMLGRAFSTEEEQWGRHRVAVLSEPFWRSHFGADPQVLGRQIELDRESYVVVGVARPMLAFVGGADVWTPLAFSPDQLSPDHRGHQFLRILARVKPGVSQSQANADLERVSAQMTKQAPDWYPKGWSYPPIPSPT